MYINTKESLSEVPKRRGDSYRTSSVRYDSCVSFITVTSMELRAGTSKQIPGQQVWQSASQLASKRASKPAASPIYVGALVHWPQSFWGVVWANRADHSVIHLFLNALAEGRMKKHSNDVSSRQRQANMFDISNLQRLLEHIMLHASSIVR